MKYLKKIFESSREEQFERIEDIFLELIDQDDADSWDEKDKNYCVFDVSYYNITNSVSNLEEFNEFIKEKIEMSNFLKTKFEPIVKRLTLGGYQWSMEQGEDNFRFKVFYKNTIDWV
jgi:hypothetical protein